MKARRVALVAGALALVALVTWLLQEPPRLVETASVDRGLVEVVIREEGRAHVHERYIISAPVSGYRPRLDWHVGDQVRAGDLLLQLQPAPSAALDPRSRAAAEADAARAASALQAAQTNAEAARARLEFAEREYERLSDLFSAGTISRQVLDQSEYALKDARAHLHSAEFSIDVARHELEAARTRVDYSGENHEATRDLLPIRAPTSGVILAVPNESEGALQAGQPLLEIGDPESLEVHAEVLTLEAVQLQPGMPARIVGWGGGQALEGRVQRVEPAAFTKISALGVEEQRTRVIVEFVSPLKDWQRLGDGYRVEVEFLPWSNPDVLRVPAGALFREEDRWMAFRLHDNKAYRVPVETGHRGETFVEVLDGLSSNDVVVMYPDNDLADGMRVTNEPR